MKKQGYSCRLRHQKVNIDGEGLGEGRHENRDEDESWAKLMSTHGVYIALITREKFVFWKYLWQSLVNF